MRKLWGSGFRPSELGKMEEWKGNCPETWLIIHEDRSHKVNTES